MGSSSCIPAVLLPLVLLVPACSGDREGDASGELTELVARAGEVTGPNAARRIAGGVDAAEDPAATEPPTGEPAPEPATTGELTALCGVYRKALRNRWDDSRARQEVHGLELTTDTARRWQSALAAGDVDTALAASRAVVAAADAAKLGAECEALAGLVDIADAMKAAPESFRR